MLYILFPELVGFPPHSVTDIFTLMSGSDRYRVQCEYIGGTLSQVLRD